MNGATGGQTVAAISFSQKITPCWDEGGYGVGVRAVELQDCIDSPVRHAYCASLHIKILW